MITSILIYSCVILVGIVFFSLGRISQLKLWKKLVVMLTGSGFGIVGLYLMAYIEKGEFGGVSFFGAHFLGPVGILIACYLLKVSKDETINMIEMSAPALCASLVALKINCFRSGCCRGIALETDLTGTVVRRFPSQIVEALFALTLMILFVVIIRKGKHHGTVFVLYQILYGVGRLVLNQFRETSPWFMNMAAGTFWSLISLLSGSLWLYIRHLRITAIEEKRQMVLSRHPSKKHK